MIDREINEIEIRCNIIMTGEDNIELTGASIADQDFIAYARHVIPNLINGIYRPKEILKSFGYK